MKKGKKRKWQKSELIRLVFSEHCSLDGYSMVIISSSMKITSSSSWITIIPSLLWRSGDAARWHWGWNLRRLFIMIKVCKKKELSINKISNYSFSATNCANCFLRSSTFFSISAIFRSIFAFSGSILTGCYEIWN